MKLITPLEYLALKGIRPLTKNEKEIMTHCVFSACDEDSRGNEWHLYIDANTGCYQCKKCLSQGNLLTLMQYFGDDPKDYPVEGYHRPKEMMTRENSRTKEKSPSVPTEKNVEKYHKALPERIRKYLNARGIDDAIIERKRLGYGRFYARNWITIPIYDRNREFLFFKLRKDPEDETNENKYMFFPTGSTAQLYGIENITGTDRDIVVCEGEFDQMIFESQNFLAVTSTGGAGTFKREWLDAFEYITAIRICFDNDDAGKKWAERLAEMISIRYPEKEIWMTHIPNEPIQTDTSEKHTKDATDHFLLHGNLDNLFSRYSERMRGTDTTKFLSLTGDDIIRILGLTIKHDDTNKLVVFLAMLSAFTENSQLNILLNAPSSSGKSYIPLEIAKLFPEESIMKLLYVSQNAFFHENGEYDKEKNEKHIHLERTIIIFIDQPRTDLLARLRPLLSHDDKILRSKITDKTGQGGNKTKNVVIHGYPVAIFCTASSELDEQEATRFLLLSPETTQEKFFETIHAKIRNEAEGKEFEAFLENHPERNLLIERIEYIRDAHIDTIVIPDAERVENTFLHGKPFLRPRHQRDIARFMGIIKAFALLNLPFRKRDASTIYAESADIDEAEKVWDTLQEGMEYGIAPHLLKVYREVFVPAYRQYNRDFGTPDSEPLGVHRKNILKKHLEVYGRPLSDAQWRQEYAPSLENAGLIIQERCGRSIVAYPIENDDPI